MQQSTLHGPSLITFHPATNQQSVCIHLPVRTTTFEHTFGVRDRLFPCDAISWVGVFDAFGQRKENDRVQWLQKRLISRLQTRKTCWKLGLVLNVHRRNFLRKLNGLVECVIVEVQCLRPCCFCGSGFRIYPCTLSQHKQLTCIFLLEFGPFAH